MVNTEEKEPVFGLEGKVDGTYVSYTDVNISDDVTIIWIVQKMIPVWYGFYHANALFYVYFYVWKDPDI